MGGWAEDLVCADPWARNPIRVSGIIIINNSFCKDKRFMVPVLPVHNIYILFIMGSKWVHNQIETFTSCSNCFLFCYIETLHVWSQNNKKKIKSNRCWLCLFEYYHCWLVMEPRTGHARSDLARPSPWFSCVSLTRLSGIRLSIKEEQPICKPTWAAANDIGQSNKQDYECSQQKRPPLTPEDPITKLHQQNMLSNVDENFKVAQKW